MIREFEEGLGVKAHCVNIADSYLIGSLAAGNSNGLVVSPYTSESEIDTLKKITNVEKLSSALSAAGNNILANDHAAIVNPKLSKKAIEIIKDVLDVDVQRATIANLRTVGAMAVATNKGVLVNADVTDHELLKMQEVFDVPIVRGTANFGSGFVGSSVLTNDQGYVAGSDTTTIEIGRIEDALDI